MPQRASLTHNLSCRCFYFRMILNFKERSEIFNVNAWGGGVGHPRPSCQTGCGHCGVGGFFMSCFYAMSQFLVFDGG